MVYTPSRIRAFPYVVTSFGAILLSVAFAPPAGAAFLLAAASLSLARAGAFERLHPDGNSLASNGLLAASAVLVAGSGFFAFTSTGTLAATLAVVATIVLAFGIVRVTRREFPDELLDTETA